jgi:hypothetical protein
MFWRTHYTEPDPKIDAGDASLLVGSMNDQTRPRKDLRGLTPVELETRLAAGAGRLKNSAYRANGSTILPCSGDSESPR